MKRKIVEYQNKPYSNSYRNKYEKSFEMLKLNYL